MRLGETKREKLLLKNNRFLMILGRILYGRASEYTQSGSKPLWVYSVENTYFPSNINGFRTRFIGKGEGRIVDT